MIVIDAVVSQAILNPDHHGGTTILFASDVSIRLYVFAHNNLRIILTLSTGWSFIICDYLWAGA
jgi:hypothetical protein